MTGNDVLDQWFGKLEAQTAPKVTTWQERRFDQPRKPATKKRSSNNIGAIGERWAKSVLESLTGGSFSKSQVQHIENETSDFWVSNDVDFVGSLPLRSGSFTTHIEVKATVGALAMSRISANERRYLDRALTNNEGALLLIVWMPELERVYRQGDVICADLVPWRQFAAVEAALLQRATGRFRGRSLRFADRDLLPACEIARNSSAWALCAGHWLAPIMSPVAPQKAPF